MGPTAEGVLPKFKRAAESQGASKLRITFESKKGFRAEGDLNLKVPSASRVAES